MGYILENPKKKGSNEPENTSSSSGYVLASPAKKGDKLKLAEQPSGGIVAGVVKGGKDILDAGAQLLSHTVPDSVREKINQANNYLADKTGLVGRVPEGGIDQQIADEEAAYQEARKEAGREGFDAARFAGNVLATLPVGGARVFRLDPSKSLIFDTGNSLRAAGQSAVVGGLQPVTQGNFGEEKTKQIATAGALGLGVAPASAAIGRVFNPQVAPEVQKLAKEGIELTPGQVLGGAFQKAEDKIAGTVPFVGDAISARRLANQEQFNRAIYAKALEGTGVNAATLPVGREGVEAVKNAVSQQYDDVLKKLVWKPDAQFNAEIKTIESMAQNLSGREKKTFINTINNIMSRSRNGVMLGETYKEVTSKLNKEAQDFLGSNDAYQRKVGTALASVLESMKDTLVRSNPQHAAELAQANKNWANYVRIRDAGKSTADQSHGFTPAAFSQAVRNTDKSVGKGKYATGNALLQDISDAASSRMSSKVPDSGTAGRLFMSGGLGAAAYANPLLIPGAISMALPYTRSGQKIMNALLTKRPEISKKAGKELANVLSRSAPAVGALSASPD